MKSKPHLLAMLLSILSIFLTNDIIAQKSIEELTPQEKVLYDEHMKWGQPDDNKILVRTAYVNSYNTEYRIPNYTVYHITSDYLNTPERTSRFKTFRTDPDIEDAVKDDEYDGLYSAYNYARGHYCPYKVLGGDRDSDGKYAHLDKTLSDEDDEQTVFEGNYMSNIAPQLHYGLNGSGGVWYKAERWVQDDVVSEDNEAWVYSGGIVLDNREPELVGDNNSIYVPDYFYKVVVMVGDDEFPNVIVFLFPHYDDKDDYVEKDIFQYTVTVDYLEAITGFDFFREFPNEVQEQFEGSVYNKSYWGEF